MVEIVQVVDWVVLLRAMWHLLSCFSCKHGLCAFKELLRAHLPDLVELTEIVRCVVDLFAALQKDSLNFT